MYDDVTQDLTCKLYNMVLIYMLLHLQKQDDKGQVMRAAWHCRAIVRSGPTCRQVPWKAMNNSLSVRPSVVTHDSKK